jgi:hypothetical protein
MKFLIFSLILLSLVQTGNTRQMRGTATRSDYLCRRKLPMSGWGCTGTWYARFLWLCT